MSGLTLHAQTDLPSTAPEYQGFRIFVTQMSLGKVKPTQTIVKATLINTGREVFKLQPALSDKLVFKFDKSFRKILAQIDSTDIINAIFNTGLTLSPGKMEREFELKVTPTPQTLIITPETLADEIPVEKELEKETTQEVEIVKVKPAKKSKQPKSKSNAEKLARKDKPKKQKTTKESVVAASEALPTPEKKTIVNPKTILEEDPAQNKTSTSKGCADLILEELKILKQNKNSVVLAYTLRNVGIGAVNINGSTSSEEGLALRGHLSSSDQLSRGALTIGGKFVKADDSEATIQPGSSYQGSVKLPLHKLTKFTPYLILQVDPYQMIMECDETNNLQFINLIPDSPMSNN